MYVLVYFLKVWNRNPSAISLVAKLAVIIMNGRLGKVGDGKISF